MTVRDAVVDDYRASLERDLLSLASDLAALIEATQLKSVMSPEPQVFYRKMIGDCYRYLAEVAAAGATDPLSPAAAAAAPGVCASAVIPAGFDKKSLDAYQVAMRLSSTHLDPTHPTRLGLCLNYSVLLLEVTRDRKAACELARQAFDQAIAKLDDLDESSYKDTTLIMQLLRDNITLWTAQEQQQQQQQTQTDAPAN